MKNYFAVQTVVKIKIKIDSDLGGCPKETFIIAFLLQVDYEKYKSTLYRVWSRTSFKRPISTRENKHGI